MNTDFMSMENEEMTQNTDDLIVETTEINTDNDESIVDIEDTNMNSDEVNDTTEESTTDILSIQESINRLYKATEVINYMIIINNRGKINNSMVRYIDEDDDEDEDDQINNEDLINVDEHPDDESIIDIGGVEWTVSGKMKNSITDQVIRNLSKLTFSDFDNVCVALKAEAVICGCRIKVNLGERKIISVVPDYENGVILVQVKALD